MSELTLTAGELSLTLLPRSGGKISRLARGGGPQWLAAPVRPVPDAGTGVLRGAWSDFDCSGWDECLPNVGAAATWADHGEVWRRAWSIEDAGPGHARLSVEVPGRFRFTRTIRLRDDLTSGVGTVEVEYDIVNIGSDVLEWAWSQHALLAAHADLRLELPPASAVRIDSAFERGRPTARADWLCPGGSVPQTSSLRAAAGRAAKVWFVGPAPRWVRVVDGSHAIEWMLGSSSVPHLGLWVNLGGWGAGPPLAHLAIEPAFGRHDSPVAALADGAGPALPPRARHRWNTLTRLLSLRH